MININNNNLFEYYKIYEKDEIEQGTPEWLKLRELKFTASRASEISTNGKGLETYVKELLAEYFSSQEFEERTGKYKSPAMQRGNDFEATARMVYEFETGNTVKEVGFIERSKYIGASPDGLINDDGLIEIKNHDDKVFLELIMTGKVDAKYIKQMQYQMWVTERKWCDYFGYNPNFSPSFYKERFYPDKELFSKFEKGVTDGIDMINNGLNALKGKLNVQKKVVVANKIIEETETNTVKVKEIKNEKSQNSDEFPF